MTASRRRLTLRCVIFFFGFLFVFLFFLMRESWNVQSETGTPLATGDMTMDRFLRLMAAQINSSVCFISIFIS